MFVWIILDTGKNCKIIPSRTHIIYMCILYHRREPICLNKHKAHYSRKVMYYTCSAAQQFECICRLLRYMVSFISLCIDFILCRV